MFDHSFICRFYGDSHPTQDASLESLKLLSSRQALADFAYFHDLMVKQYKLTDRNKWVCFGGSYSGALAAWLRQLYPKAVVGGVASSAPVLAKLDYVEYKEIIGQSLATRGRSWGRALGLSGSGETFLVHCTNYMQICKADSTIIIIP